MKLGTTEVAHFKNLIEELLFRIKEDSWDVITDLEDEILICAEILGIDTTVEDEDTTHGY